MYNRKQRETECFEFVKLNAKLGFLYFIMDRGGYEISNNDRITCQPGI